MLYFYGVKGTGLGACSQQLSKAAWRCYGLQGTSWRLWRTSICQTSQNWMLPLSCSKLRAKPLIILLEVCNLDDTSLEIPTFHDFSLQISTFHDFLAIAAKAQETGKLLRSPCSAGTHLQLHAQTYDSYHLYRKKMTLKVMAGSRLQASTQMFDRALPPRLHALATWTHFFNF